MDVDQSIVEFTFRSNSPCFIIRTKTAFTRCRQILKTVKNVTDRPPVHTKTAHFCRQISKTVDFENGTLTGINLKQHRKQIIFQRFWIETGRFLVCRYFSSASKSRNEILLSIFLPFSNCAGIV